MSFNKPLGSRKSPKQYMGQTEADLVYYQLVQGGMDSKTAAKQAQNQTGLSLLTGQRMKSRGFGWQNTIGQDKP